eukprot:scaffold1.g5674.t1
MLSGAPPRPAATRPSIVLFGDSITQKGFGLGGWAAALANQYQRRADVINRGYNGYNTRWALNILDRVLPPGCGAASPGVSLAVIWFGANDAALPDLTSARQHVPLPEYQANLEAMVAHAKQQGVQSVLLLTPPPVSEPERIAHALRTYNIKLKASERTNEVAGQYAAAAKAAAARHGVACVDLHAALQATEGWQQLFLEDGLHLTPAGNDRVAKLLVDAIEGSFPHLRANALPMDAPDHSVINSKNPTAAFTAFYGA